MAEHRKPVKAVQATDVRSVYTDKSPGTYAFNDARDMFVFACPCGCKAVRAFAVTDGPKVEHRPKAWLWNGLKDRPTLAPLIQIIGECGYHGRLTNGEFTFL